MNSEKSISLKYIENYLDSEVTLLGWLQGKRGSNHIQFLQIRNSGIIIQVVAEKESLGEEIFSKIKSLTQETSIELKGIVHKSEKSELGYEIILKSYKTISESINYPITPKEHGIDFLHNNRHLWLRSRKQLAIMKVRNETIFAIRKYFYDSDYMLIDTPILTGSVGESAGTLFETEYFDLGKAYLAQTGQLYLETAIFAHDRVYCFGPTFRAEKSKTRRHLTEFWMLEVETSHFSNEENIDLQGHFVRKVISDVLQSCKNELKILERDTGILEKFISEKFASTTYTGAIEILKSKNVSIEWGEDINAENESIITDHFGKPTFIKNYPRAIK
ncbi:MAG: asparagine--tRNA ligase, partial [Leptospiraceae bacterium]|nr:asparagine--tRNA ligase [Leptospiraceae bacterium]